MVVTDESTELWRHPLVEMTHLHTSFKIRSPALEVFKGNEDRKSIVETMPPTKNSKIIILLTLL